MRRLIGIGVLAAVLFMGSVTVGAAQARTGVITIFQTVQSAATTGNGTAIVPTRERDFVFYVEWGASTSAGVITIEEASDSTYTDTWSTLATVTWAAADTTEAVHLTGAYSAVRARISTTVVGGTVTVEARGM